MKKLLFALFALALFSFASCEKLEVKPLTGGGSDLAGSVQLTDEATSPVGGSDLAGSVQ